MMRSMYSGVSALRAHQLRMDVIGNNIANVNTVGFKGSSVTFSDLYSQILSGASSSSESRGGTNPQQVGLGSKVAAITVNHTKGSVQRTDVPTDLMIDGNGYFMVTSDANAQNVYYTRAGNFIVDELGYLVTSDGGLKVLDNEKKPIQINMSDTVNASASQKITLKGNLNFNDEDYTTTIDLYDSLGDVHTVNMSFVGEPLTLENAPIDTLDPKDHGSATDANYSYRQFVITDESGVQKTPSDSADTWYVKFNDEGEVVNFVRLDTSTSPYTESAIDPSVTPMTLTLKAPGAADIVIPIDRSIFFKNGDATSGVRTFTQYSQESDAKGVQLEGRSAGSITSFNISPKGEVIGIYSNGAQEILQTIGLAKFDNPSGLMTMGSNLFQQTPNSGVAAYGMPSTGSFGAVTAGALEMSNVDLSVQFTDMITTQRGFQANSRVITTSDEILQELVNLKR